MSVLGLPIKGINMTQFGVIDNIATTGHKLQEVSLKTTQPSYQQLEL